MSRKEEILQGANAAQQAVIKSIYGKYVTMATAGAGKTWSIVLRTAYMIESGISADQILMFTFTRKAAEEMKTRVEKFIGPKAKGLTVSTYHSFCGKLLRQYAYVVGLQKNYTIYDEEDSMAALKIVISQNLALKGIDIKQVKSSISNFKENLISPEQALSRVNNPAQEKIAVAYRDYTAYLHRSNACDFDDLTYYTVKAMQQSKEMRDQVNDQYRFIIADEGHDSSLQNLTLIELLSGPDREKWNLMVICDPDQSIYSFRGANIAAFINFIKKNNLVQLNMGQNYRSTKTIVEAADGVVKHNKIRIDKEVFTENEQGNKISMFTCVDEAAEAKKIAAVIKACVSQGTLSYNDIAVLYRTRGQSQNIEKVLLKQGIPYKIVSGKPFFARRVVKDLLAYARLVVNPNDREAFKRIVNVPHRHIGDASLKAILDYLTEHEEASLYDACEKVSFRQRETQKGIDNFVATIKALCDITNQIETNEYESENVNAAVLIRETYNITNYGDFIKEHMSDDVDQCESDISALINVASEYKTVEEFMVAVTEYEVNNEEDEDVTNSTVKLMTMHGSKGLEWPVVIVAGCNDGTSPSFWAMKEGNLEEERRLFFGMNR